MILLIGGEDRMNKDKIKQMVTSKFAIAIISGLICFSIGFSVNGPSAESEAKLESLQDEVDGSKSKISDLEATNSELQAKVDEAKPWFEMKENERKAEEERLANEKAEKEAQEEKEREEEEAKQAHKIGERIVYKYGSNGEFALTIDNVNLTDERNQFADPVKNVVEISYTVENISMEELDFFMSNQAEFYDSEGYKCSTYALSSGDGTYDIGKGKKASGKEYICIEQSEVHYLEMDLGGTIYKWTLQ